MQRMCKSPQKTKTKPKNTLSEQIHRNVSEVTVILALSMQPEILPSLEAFQTFSLLQNLINLLTAMNKTPWGTA